MGTPELACLLSKEVGGNVELVVVSSCAFLHVGHYSSKWGAYTGAWCMLLEILQVSSGRVHWAKTVSAKVARVV